MYTVPTTSTSTNADASVTSIVYVADVVNSNTRYDYNRNDITNNNQYNEAAGNCCRRVTDDVNVIEDVHHQEKFVCELLDDRSEKNEAFDEDAYIKSILADHQIDDIDNNNSEELSEFEKDILNKYMREFEAECRTNDAIGTEAATKPLDRFPVAEPTHSTTGGFPIKGGDVVVVRPTSASPIPPPIQSTSQAESVFSDQMSGEYRGERPSTQVVFHNSQRNLNNSNIRHIINLNHNNNNNRGALRRNFSIWVGVTSCVWGLLLYLDKSYF